MAVHPLCSLFHPELLAHHDHSLRLTSLAVSETAALHSNPPEACRQAGRHEAVNGQTDWRALSCWA